MTQQALIFQKAKDNSTGTNPDHPWIKCHVHQNVTSSYRREDDGSLSLKLEGRISGIPLFEQVSVMREVDLYHTWAPFVSKSGKLAQLGKLDQVGWFEVSPPLAFGLVRDACYRAIGCDCMMESGEVIVVAEGLEDDDDDDVDVDDDDEFEPIGGHYASPNKRQQSSYLTEQDGDIIQNLSSKEEGDYNNNRQGGNDDADYEEDADELGDDEEEYYNSEYDSTDRSADASIQEETFINHFLAREDIMNDIELPPRPTGMNKNRLKLKFFQGVIKVTSPTEANTLLVANIDPRVKFLPQFAIDFIMKHMCGILLVKMQNAARRALVNHREDPLAQRMRDDNFYKCWLLPKFESYAREMGWELPEVNALKSLGQKDDGSGGSGQNRNRASTLPFSKNVTSGGRGLRIHLDEAATRSSNVSLSSRGSRFNLRRRRKNKRGSSDTGSTTDQSQNASLMATGAGALTSTNLDDASSRTSRRSPLAMKFGRKKNIGSSGSIQSAPELGSRPIASKKSRKVQFSAERLERLKALKRFKEELGDEAPAMKNRSITLVKNVTKGDNTRFLSYFMNDISHSIVAPTLFILMLFVMHGFSHDDFISKDHSVLRNLSTTMVFVTVFSCAHWAVVETMFVSIFDAIDLPVIKFTGNHKSSSTRLYVIDQIHLYSQIFSGALGLLCIVRRLIIGSFHVCFWLFQKAMKSDQVDPLSSDNFTAFLQQTVKDSKMVMTYCAVFIAICCLIAVICFPSRGDTSDKAQRKPLKPTVDISLVQNHNGMLSPTSTASGNTLSPTSYGQLQSIPESPPVIPEHPMSW